MDAAELALHFDRLLRTDAFRDDSLNGLQVGCRVPIQTVAFAVDASLSTIQQASENGAQFLVVHHGLFWGKPLPITGVLYERIRACIENRIALYASHLPLDAHPEFGNNAQLVKRLKLPKPEDFGEYHGNVIGKKVRLKKAMSIETLIGRIRNTFKSEPILWGFGPSMSRHIAVISGQALSMLEQAARAGCDTLLTGESDHAHYWTAKEYGLNVLFGGHYCTETLGVKALQAEIQTSTDLHTVFIDNPTGY
jgi:dinuclear metal center YbgI/SA1388 family protein